MIISMMGESWEVDPAEITSDANRAVLQQPAILIVKARRSLTVLNGNSPIKTYPVALGKPATPPPLGNYAIATKILNPGGVLGTRSMGLNFDAYGIHGTNRPWLIGQLVSNGCIRMHNDHVEELYNFVRLGTQVFIRDET